MMKSESEVEQEEKREEEDDDVGRRRTAASKRSGSNPEGEGTGDMAKRHANNCWQNFGLCCFKMKENTKISVLEFKIKQRQQQFGIDYLTLIKEGATPQQLKDCVKEAKQEVSVLSKQVDELDDNIDDKEREVESKKIANPNPTPPKPKKKNNETKEGFIEKNMKRMQQVQKEQAEMEQQQRQMYKQQEDQRKQQQKQTKPTGGGTAGTTTSTTKKKKKKAPPQ